MINDLPKRITSHVALYADDFCFWECGSDITLLNQLCQRSLTKVCKWCEDCGFRLSSTKSAAALFTREHNPAPISLRLQDGTRLPQKNEYKYLGLTFQRSGSYSTHIQKVVAKCRARLSVIRMLKGTSWGASKRPILTVYRSLVRSVIEYGMEAHFFASPSLQKIQNDALRLYTGALVSTPVICLHHACNEMPLNIKHKFLCLKFKAHLLSFSDHPALSLTEDCWQECFPDSPGFCSFNVHKDWGWSFRFRRRSRAHPKYASLVDTKTRHQPHSLTVCPSDGICIRCTGFSLRICTMYMISLLKSIQTDQKPLHEPVAVYM